MMSDVELIYKITPRAQWETAESVGCFEGAPIDLADGYIHFSTSDQVEETAAKHFSGQGDLLLVAVNVSDINADLKWEVSRGGALFPHLYAALPTAAVRWVKPMPLDERGIHVLPSLDA